MTVLFVVPEMQVTTWRSGWPVQELRRRGYDAVLSARGRPIPQVREPVTTVLHVLNRTWQAGEQIITPLDLCHMWRERGRLIVSFDDDLTQLLELEKPYGGVRDRARVLHQQIPEICRTADKIVVATPRLAEVYGRWGEVAVAENYLPRWVFDLERKPRKNRVAWMGTMAGYVHGRDWDLLRPYAKDLPPLTLIGTEPQAGIILRRWGAKDVEIIPGTTDQRKLYRLLGRARAAIVPLADTRFQRGKSWIKPMEFMARRVQPFTSAHREYDRLGELTGACPTFADPGDLVQAVAEGWEQADGAELPRCLLDLGMTMEQAGGDAWEKALL